MSLIHQVIAWYIAQMTHIGLELYVFLGMLIESSFIPFPSEIVMPPAAHQAAQAGRFARVILLIVCGTGGSLIGAYINYFLGLYFGRPIFEKYGKYFLISESNLAKMDRFWDRYGEAGTFICRFVPVVRQLISVPAGISRMNLWKFTLFTGLGSCIWVTVLAMVGWFLRNWSIEDFETKLHGQMMPWVIGGCVLLIAAYGVKLMWQRGGGQAKE